MPSEASQRIRATFVPASEPDQRSLAEQRRAWEDEALRQPLPPGSTVTLLTLRGVACELIETPQNDARRRLLFLHGGGFEQGSCKTHRHLAAQLSLVSVIPVLLVDYRLAPEYPFPAAFEDAVQVYQALLDDGFAPSDLAVGGDSAGGGLAISLLLALRDAGIPQPAAAVLLSPWADLSLSGESMATRLELDPLTQPQALFHCAAGYLGRADARDPLASPVYADLQGLPPLMIHVGDHELLLSDSLRLADNARAAGVPVDLAVWEAMWHVFPAWAPDLPEGQTALKQVGAFLGAADYASIRR